MISKQESFVIVYVRSIAMFCIVLCHIQQAYNSKWAWIFNVGVQIFLAISGWLYGNKNISNWRKWYIDKLKKLYIPYISYVAIIFMVYKIFAIDCFSLKALIIYLLDLQWLLGSVDGLTHLWFMTAIAICYIITPILQYLKNKDRASLGLFLLSIVGILNFFIFKIYLSIFSPLFVYIYIYMFVCLSPKQQRIYLSSIIIAFIYVLLNIDWIFILDYTNYINLLFHVLLGLLCVILPIKIVNKMNNELIVVYPLVGLLDKYSYFVYITHHIFMLGPLSIAFFTSNILFNIIIMLILTCLTTLFLKFLSEKLIY